MRHHGLGKVAAARRWSHSGRGLGGSDQRDAEAARAIAHLRAVRLVLLNRGEPSGLRSGGVLRNSERRLTRRRGLCVVIDIVTTMLGMPSLEQLDEMVEEAVDVLDETPHHVVADALRVQATQCRAALQASRLHAFGPFVLRALSTKVLRLKIDALSYRESRLGHERISSGTMQAAAAAWGTVEPPTMTRMAIPRGHV